MCLFSGIGYGLGLNMVTQATLVLIVQYFPDKNSTRSVSAACTGLTIGKNSCVMTIRNGYMHNITFYNASVIN